MSLSHTPLAATSFNNSSGLHIRVYYQAPNGDIKEAVFDESTNWAPGSQNTVGTGKLNTGIAAINWSNGQEIRVYYLDQDSKIVERCSGGAGGWVTGGLTGKFQAAPYSKIAAVKVKNDSPEMRVYYQDTTNKLREIVYAPGWTEGTSGLPTAIAGTGITANVEPDADRAGEIWVYYQGVDYALAEQWFDGSVWRVGAFKATRVFPPGTSISAASWSSNSSNSSTHRVASVDENNQLGVTPFDNGTWRPTTDVGQVTITLSDVAIISVNGGSDLRLFFQPSGGAIAELTSADANTWSSVTDNILG